MSWVGTVREAVRDVIQAGMDDAVAVVLYSGNVQYPCILVDNDPDFISYHESFGSNPLGQFRFRLRVMTSATNAESAEKKMDDFLSWGDQESNSVHDAVEQARVAARSQTPPLIGGIIQDMVVLTATGPITDDITDAAGKTVRRCTAEIPLIVVARRNGAA